MLEGRNSKVDIIRGVAVILVMTGHGIDLLIKKNIMPEKLGWEIYNIIYMFHMPLFFLIAGYVYQSNREKIAHIVIKNVITCYVPYLFLNYLYWIERAAASRLPGVHLDQSVTGFSWKELLRLSYGGDGLTWFLLSFMLVRILFNILDTYVSGKAAFICFSILFWIAFAFPQNRILTLVVCVNVIAFGIVRYRENHFDILVKLLIGGRFF